MELPCLILAYSRVQGVKNLLDQCLSNGVNTIYVAIDGPRSEIDKINQRGIRELVDEYSSTTDVPIRVWQREQNLGVAVAIITAIDWFFESEPQGIILEDDLLVRSDFFDFVANGLTEFVEDSSVWTISGNQFFPDNFAPSRISWSHYPLIWGWGTWAEKWIEMRSHLLADKQLPGFLSFDPVATFWTVGGNRVLNGLVDTWDIPLAGEMKRLRKYSVLPPVNLVSNIGNDSAASHTSNSEFPMELPVCQIELNLDFGNSNRKAIAKKMDALLESRVFKVKRRHALLPIWSRLTDRKKFEKSPNRAPLSERVAAVVIPKIIG
jgi:hypothetical protein